MSRGGRARETAGVSLFPFLAVLLCTMGALIVLLVILARRVEAQAREQYLVAVAERAQKDQDRRQAQAARQESQNQAATDLRSKAEAVAAALRAKQQTTAHLQADLAQAQQHLRQLQEQQRDLERQSSQRPADDQLRRQSAELDERLRQAQAILSDRQRAAVAPPQELYSIVPYAGRNGAARRPIYLECRGDRIIFQPEGTELLAPDFDVVGPGNPLEAAVRATVAHRDAAGQNDNNSYPLLLVRPDGVQAYHAARDALSTWGREFGYELVEQDWKLAYPPADAALAQKQQAAIAAGRQQMELLAKSQSGRRRASPSFRISSAGGLERVGGGSGGGGEGDGLGGDGDGFAGGGTGSGFGGRGSGRGGAGLGGAAANPGGPGAGLAGGGPGMGDRAGGLASARRRPGDFLGGSSNGAGGASGTGPEGSAFGGNGGGNGDPNNPLGSRFAESQTQQLPFRQAGQPGGSPFRGDPTGNGIGPLAGVNGSGGGGQFGGPFGGRGDGSGDGGGFSGGGAGQFANGQQQGLGPTGSRSSSSDPFAGVGSQLDRARGVDRQPGDGGRGGGSGDAADGRGSRGSSGQGGSGGPYAQGGPGGPYSQGGPGGPSAQGALGGAGGSGMGMPGPQSMSGASGASMGTAGGAAGGMTYGPSGGADPSGQPSFDGPEISSGGPSFSPVARVTPISKKEGKNWALPTKPVRGSSPLRRDVPLMVDESAITVFVDPRTAQTLQIIRFGPDPTEVTGQLKDAIWKVMKDWGNAPAGFHWRPVLRTQITPRGNTRFSQLDTLLQDSGFELANGQG